MKLRVTGLLDHTVCAPTIFYLLRGGGRGEDILMSTSVPNDDVTNDLFKYIE